MLQGEGAESCSGTATKLQDSTGMGTNDAEDVYFAALVPAGAEAIMRVDDNVNDDLPDVVEHVIENAGRDLSALPKDKRKRELALLRQQRRRRRVAIRRASNPAKRQRRWLSREAGSAACAAELETDRARHKRLMFYPPAGALRVALMLLVSRRRRVLPCRCQVLLLQRLRPDRRGRWLLVLSGGADGAVIGDRPSAV